MPEPSALEIRCLLINADDFGLSDGVCESILELGARGCLTSTSVLAPAPRFGSWAEDLKRSDLGVGAHLAAVGEDPPVSDPSQISTLVDSEGSFPRSWKELSAGVLRGRIDPTHVATEWRAQIELIQSTGLVLDHIDTHQHVHLLPSLAAEVSKLAEEFDLAVRIPVTETISPLGLGVRWLSKRLNDTLSAANNRAYRSWGIDDAGHLNAQILADRVDLVAVQPPGYYEISLHPGPEDESDLGRYEWGYEWGAESGAVSSSEFRDKIAGSGLRLCTASELKAPLRKR